MLELLRSLGYWAFPVVLIAFAVLDVIAVWLWGRLVDPKSRITKVMNRIYDKLESVDRKRQLNRRTEREYLKAESRMI